MAGVDLRRLLATEWRELRDLRLHALRDAPLAFGSTYEREVAYTDEHWQREAAAAEAGISEVDIVAVVDGAHVGMARGYVGSADEPDPRPVVWLIAVYVDPAWRGKGLGRSLSEKVVAWARECDVGEVLLHVADWNTPARRAYESLGSGPPANARPWPTPRPSWRPRWACAYDPPDDRCCAGDPPGTNRDLLALAITQRRVTPTRYACQYPAACPSPRPSLPATKARDGNRQMICPRPYASRSNQSEMS